VKQMQFKEIWAKCNSTTNYDSGWEKTPIIVDVHVHRFRFSIATVIFHK